MHAQIFLIAPADADPARLETLLQGALETGAVSALLLPRGTQAENAYKALVKAIAPSAQQQGCAVLIEGEPGLVKTLGADGLHFTGPVAGLKAAVAALRPQMIVGTATPSSRHEAMTRGEMDVDYVMFGPLSGAIDAETRELAHWWAETMQIPSILSDPEATPETLNAEGCEFIGLGESIWRAPDPAAALAALAARLEGDH